MLAVCVRAPFVPKNTESSIRRDHDKVHKGTGCRRAPADAPLVFRCPDYAAVGVTK
jgi:hypothetical protein